MINNPQKIIVHHSADSYNGNQFDKINQWHKQKWNFISSLGFYGGYHYLIEMSGEIKQYRAENEEAAHCKGHNFTSIGICLAGNFDFGMPNDKQIESLIKLVDEIIGKYKLEDSEIYSHRHFGQTSCYGKLLSDDWAKELYLNRKIELTKKLLYLVNLLLRFLKIKK